MEGTRKYITVTRMKQDISTKSLEEKKIEELGKNKIYLKKTLSVVLLITRAY